MADKQSREEINIEKSLEQVGNNTAAAGKRIAKGLMDFGKYTEGSPDVEYIGDKPKPSEVLTVKIDVDVSEALTGLKVLTREAREATKALRELEEQAKNAEVINVLDKDRGLIASIGTEEIIKRKDVTVEIDGKEIVKTAPEHVKNYGKGEGWSNKGSKSNGGVWFDKSITDDIRRSYEEYEDYI